TEPGGDSVLIEVRFHTGGTAISVSCDGPGVFVVHIHAGGTVIGKYVEYFEMGDNFIALGNVRWNLIEQPASQQGVGILYQHHAITVVQKRVDFTLLVWIKQAWHDLFIFR